MIASLRCLSSRRVASGGSPLSWLIGLGSLSLPIYIAALLYGPFRPGRIEPFFWMFGGAFALYGLASWRILHADTLNKYTLALIFAFAMLFNVVLLLTQPTLSDDMYRYVWDGRVQASGINPYRFPSDAPELERLRDNTIWAKMNRKSAVTIYPPGAQLVFALLWRIAPDSILAFKSFMVACVLVCGWMLVRLLRALGERPERVLIFLWSPLLIFEIAHSGHVDALYLPCLVGAMVLRATSPSDRISTRHEALVGFLLGIATLTKLYPAMLLAPLWSVRDGQGRRRWRIAMPMTMLATIAAGYALYLAPGADTLGFLPNYSREFFNAGPLPAALMQWAPYHGIDFFLPVSILMPALVALLSMWYLLFPARSAREAIMRCLWPLSVYLIVSQNLFSWYVLAILPLVALGLQPGKWLGWTINPTFAWWLFSGLVALSYTLFITGWQQDWTIWVQFIPLYGLLILGLLNRRLRLALRKETCNYSA